MSRIFKEIFKTSALQICDARLSDFIKQSLGLNFVNRVLRHLLIHVGDSCVSLDWYLSL